MKTKTTQPHSTKASGNNITILASPIPATYLVGPAIAEFMTHCPDTRVQLLTNFWNQSAIEKTEYDLGVFDISGLGNNTNLECEELIKSPAKMCCRLAHPLIQQQNYSTVDVNQYPLALPSNLPQYVNYELSRLLNRPLINDQCAAEIYYDSLLTVRHTLFNSNTIAIAPHIAMTQSLNDQLKALNPVDWPTIEADFGIVKHSNKETTEVMNIMMDALFNIADSIRTESLVKAMSS
ncbi:substrate-binding domain-containing protein [Kangiella shandongensis]|uniref:substrate-binding domain-containing protein n=1 Tax=Kangiella shandongensis TaxID=2763258 RepID=UPI001CBCFA63|nr:substrate-binding domain-containing protein [Kangiella shandongensis]